MTISIISFFRDVSRAAAHSSETAQLIYGCYFFAVRLFISQSSYLHSEHSSLFLIVTDGNISNLGVLFNTEGVRLSHSGDRVNQETVNSMDEATK